MIALSVVGFAIAWLALLALLAPLLLGGYHALTGPHHRRKGSSRAIIGRSRSAWSTP
jgi:hypothetical protein